MGGTLTLGTTFLTSIVPSKRHTIKWTCATRPKTEEPAALAVPAMVLFEPTRWMASPYPDARIDLPTGKSADGGKPFSFGLMAARLRRARIYLLDPAQADLSIADIAFRCGFLDVSSFYRAFRAAYNVTPKSLREQAPSSRPD